MRISSPSLRSLIEAETDATIEFLQEIISIPSISGDEGEVLKVVAKRFSPLLDELECIPFPANFTEDPEYSSPLAGLNYASRFNVRGVLRGGQNTGALIFNTHADVVPPSKGHRDPFLGRLEHGVVHGRGSCDAKGQIATLYLLLRALRRLETRPSQTLIFHLVTEEEIGGNGTLALMRHEGQAAEAVILEPTACRLVTSVRGAVWFRLRLTGVSGHSGSAGSTISALKLAVEAMEILERYQQELLEASRALPLFNDFSNPMPITFGKLNAGNWPAATPNEATLEGVLGFLSNKTREAIITEIESALRTQGSASLRENFSLELMYRHNAHVTPPESTLAAGLRQALGRAGLSDVPTAFPASCDSWFYPHMLGVPAVVFGPGELRHAHAADEQIEVAQIVQAAQVLTDFVLSRG